MAKLNDKYLAENRQLKIDKQQLLAENEQLKAETEQTNDFKKKLEEAQAKLKDIYFCTHGVSIAAFTCGICKNR